MPLEIHSRLYLPIAPIDDDEVVRKADLVGLGGAAHFGTQPPDNPGVGQLWATPDADLAVWTGSSWLPINVIGGALVPDWNSDVMWNDPRFMWG